MVGIDPTYDRLYDPQQAEPAGWCPVCGAEIWEAGQDVCTRCEEREER